MNGGKAEHAFTLKNLDIWKSVCIKQLAVFVIYVHLPLNMKRRTTVWIFYLKRVSLFARKLHNIPHHEPVSLSNSIVWSLRFWT